MAATAKVKVNVKPLDFAGISLLAGNVITGLTASALYPMPNPNVATLTLAKTTLDTAIATWGPVHNRGSHNAYLDLVSKATLMRNLLFQEAAYVQTATNIGGTWATQAADIVTSGFSVKNLPTPQGLLGVPQNFHQVFSNAVAANTPWLDWSKPLGLNSPNNVASYEIFRSLVNVQPSIAIASVTATKFIDTDPAIAGTQQFYWIQGLNDAGLGAPTASLFVSIPL